MSIAAVSSHRSRPISSDVTYSPITKVGVYWSPGQGVVAPGQQGRKWGLYLTGTVKQNHGFHVEHVKRDNSKKTVTITADAPGRAPLGKKTQSKEAFVVGGFSMLAERWTVVVKDQKGHQLLKKHVMLGGPPAS